MGTSGHRGALIGWTAAERRWRLNAVVVRWLLWLGAGASAVAVIWAALWVLAATFAPAHA
ncbi:MAG: hypothetical protein AAF721_20640 [Myxococcota bacterium]